MSFASVVATSLIAEIALAAIMAGAWAVQRATRQTGWIDAIWTFGVGATGAALAAAAARARSWVRLASGRRYDRHRALGATARGTHCRPDPENAGRPAIPQADRGVGRGCAAFDCSLSCRFRR